MGLGGAMVGSGLVSAKPGIERLLTYDAAAGELPENIAIDKRGTKYVSFPPLGEIRSYEKANLTESTIADLNIGAGQGIIGLEVDPQGTVYACLVTFDTPESVTHGIWHVPRGGEPALFASLPPDTFPNDILLFGDSLLVTETVGGSVLRVRRNSATEWVSHEFLEGTGDFPGFPPLGANGIARASDGDVYVAVTEKSHIVRIPVNPDGNAGNPEVFVSDPRLFAVDGLAVDVRDDLYAAIIGQDSVLRVTQNGSIETLATAPADGLDGPSDVTFGTSRGNQKSVFITNFALLTEDDPSLMQLDVGVPGRSIHP
jgi:hypothetical protein